MDGLLKSVYTWVHWSQRCKSRSALFMFAAMNFCSQSPRW